MHYAGQGVLRFVVLGALVFEKGGRAERFARVIAIELVEQFHNVVTNIRQEMQQE